MQTVKMVKPTLFTRCMCFIQVSFFIECFAIVYCNFLCFLIHLNAIRLHWMFLRAEADMNLNDAQELREYICDAQHFDALHKLREII